MAAVIGSNVWSGTATIAAAGPGAYGEVVVTLAESLAATDKVVASISHTASQDATNMKFKDFNFQIIKDDSANTLTFKSLVEQNKAVVIDYFVVGNSTE